MLASFFLAVEYQDYVGLKSGKRLFDKSFVSLSFVWSEQFVVSESY